MAIIISEETRQQFQAEGFSDAEIDEIRETAKSQAVVETVGKGTFALHNQNFLLARIVDIATRGTLVDVVYHTIHETEKLLEAGLTPPQITELAINANFVSDVDDVLRTAQKVKEDELSPDAMRELKAQLKELKRRFCPQSTTPSVAAAAKEPAPAVVSASQ